MGGREKADSGAKAARGNQFEILSVAPGELVEHEEKALTKSNGRRLGLQKKGPKGDIVYHIHRLIRFKRRDLERKKVVPEAR